MRTVIRSLPGLIALVSLVVAVPVRARFEPIVVTVTEPDGVARREWPLTVSVPIPRGVVKNADGLALTEESGAGLPMQARVLSRWRDGSVKWLLIDTQVHLSARQGKRLRVVSGKRHAASGRLQVTEQADRLRIDTGVLQFSIPKSRFGIVEDVQAGRLALKGPITSLISRDGQRTNARPPRHVTIVEKGPLRVRIEMEGTYGNGFDYVMRVDAFAGQPFVRVYHTFIDRDPQPFIPVQQIAVEWPLESKHQATYSVGVDGGPPRTGSVKAEAAPAVQLDNVTMRLNGSDGDGKLAGWIAVHHEAGVVGLSTRWFWQQYPQSFSVLPDRFTYSMWAPEATPAQVGMGAAKTHEFVVWAGGASLAEAGWAGTVVRPLVGTLDAAAVVRTASLPQAIAANHVTEQFLAAFSPAFDRYLRRNDSEPWDDRPDGKCDSWLGERARTGAYGMWNWGDWNFPGYQDHTKGCDAWGNLEYDTAQVLALGFIATGRPEMHDAMVAAARHFMDVDTIYYQAQRPEWVGMNHPKNPLHFSFDFGGVDLGHTWTEGLVSYFYLTGDDRGLAAARGIADYLVRRSRGMILRANPRQLGWPVIALLAVYDATGEREYLDAAKEYAQRALRAYPADDVDHWKHGILADALASMHSVSHDPEIERWLRSYAQTVVRRKKTDDLRFLPGLAYAATLTGDPALRAAVLRRMGSVNLGSWGKPFTINGRLGFRVYSLLGGGSAAGTSRKPTARPQKRKR